MGDGVFHAAEEDRFPVGEVDDAFAEGETVGVGFGVVDGWVSTFNEGLDGFGGVDESGEKVGVVVGHARLWGLLGGLWLMVRDDSQDHR